MHTYDTLTQLTHERQRELRETGQTERLQRTTCGTRRRRLRLRRRRELLLGTRHATQA